VLSEAIEWESGAGDPALVADARIALADLRVHRTAQGREDVMREIEAAIEVFEALGDKARLGSALTLRGKYRVWGGDAVSALPDLERALACARSAGNWVDEADCIQYICVAMRVGPTPAEEALRRLNEVEPLARVNARLEEAVLSARAHFVATLGDFEVARGLATRAIALAEEHGFEAGHARFVKGQVEFLAGNAEAAERELRIVCEHYEQVEEFGFLSSTAPHLAEAVLAQGRDEEALLLTDRWPAARLTVPEDVDGQAQWRRVRAKILARRGELEEAESLAREAVTIASATADILDLRAEAFADLGDVLGLADRLEESRAAFAEAMRLYEAKGNVVGAGRVRALLAERPIEA
jgi:tetratricopeptide (TPR) repeat protein